MDRPQRDLTRALLRRVKILAELGDRELDALRVVSRALDAGEILFRKGQPGAAAYVLASGRLKVTSMAQNGREHLRAILGEGAVVGELALLDGRDRSATVTALEPARLLVIDRRDLLAVVRAHPDVALKLLSELGGRVRELGEALEEAIFLGLPARLARRLLALAGRFGRPTGRGRLVDLPLAQKDLAQMVGASREAVNKQLRAWRAAGVVALERGRVAILDGDALDEIARRV